MPSAGKRAGATEPSPVQGQSIPPRVPIPLDSPPSHHVAPPNVPGGATCLLPHKAPVGCWWMGPQAGRQDHGSGSGGIRGIRWETRRDHAISSPPGLCAAGCPSSRCTGHSHFVVHTIEFTWILHGNTSSLPLSGKKTNSDALIHDCSSNSICRLAWKPRTTSVCGAKSTAADTPTPIPHHATVPPTRDLFNSCCLLGCWDFDGSQ